jgi:hypothetical protein
VSHPLPAPEGADGSSSQPEGRLPVSLQGVRGPLEEDCGALFLTAEAVRLLPAEAEKGHNRCSRRGGSFDASIRRPPHPKPLPRAPKLKPEGSAAGVVPTSTRSSRLDPKVSSQVPRENRRSPLLSVPKVRKACGLHSAAPLWRLARPEGLARCRWGALALTVARSIRRPRSLPCDRRPSPFKARSEDLASSRKVSSTFSNRNAVRRPRLSRKRV